MNNGRRLTVVLALTLVLTAAACGRTELYAVARHGAGGAMGSGGRAGTGGTATGTGGAVAGTGGALVGTGGMIACGPLIDDVESGTGRICQGDGRIGMWYAFNDGYFNLVQWPAPTPGVPIPTSDIPGGRGASKRAMRTYGGAPGAWGAGLGIDLSFDGTTYGTYDARAWDGVTFWARTATNLSHMAVRISSVPTTSVKYGGTCTNEISTPATSCNPYAEDVPLSSDWTQYWVAFPHDGRPDFTQDRLTNIQFLAPPGYDYDLWIDDVSFFAGRAGCCPSPPRGCSGSVTFPDAAVEQAVRKATTRSTGDLRCADLCSIVSLTFIEPGPSGDLSGLECVINLTDLRINYSVYGGTAPDPQPTISDLTPLTGLTRLTTLYLSYNAIADLRPLAGLTNLTSLDLRGNQIVDITALAPLTGLTHLDIGQNHIRDVSALTRMTGLYDIALDHNEISQGLEALSRYTSVNLASNQVSDLSPFARFPNLGALYLNDNRVTDLGPLAGYATLGVLDVSYNAISDLGPVATMTGLGVLQAAHNRIADLPPLARSAAPFTLDVSGNLVRDLTPLAGLPRYSTIDARDNLITDLAPLTAVPQLFITAAGNPIDCKSQLPVLDKLAADGDTLDFPVVLSGATGQTPPTCP